jgi:hypothetical protein
MQWQRCGHVAAAARDEWPDARARAAWAVLTRPAARAPVCGAARWLQLEETLGSTEAGGLGAARRSGAWAGDEPWGQ